MLENFVIRHSVKLWLAAWVNRIHSCIDFWLRLFLGTGKSDWIIITRFSICLDSLAYSFSGDLQQHITCSAEVSSIWNQTCSVSPPQSFVLSNWEESKSENMLLKHYCPKTQHYPSLAESKHSTTTFKFPNLQFAPMTLVACSLCFQATVRMFSGDRHWSCVAASVSKVRFVDCPGPLEVLAVSD